MIRADCHFHPNIPFFLPEWCIRWHVQKIWKTFAKRKLDVVFISEHAYKHPRISYETLLRYRPSNANTFLIPAVEALSKEGIEMIVFSKDVYVYTRGDILKPFGLSIETMVEKVHKDKKLFGVLPHPYTPSGIGFLRKKSEDRMLRDEKLLHFAEKYNGSFLSTERLIRFLHIRHFIRRMFQSLKRTMCMPVRMTPHGITILGGSDAHFVWDLGSCLCIKAPRPQSFQEAFTSVISNRYQRTFTWRRARRFPLIAALREGITTLHENLMKRLHLYRLDTMFTQEIGVE